MAQNTYSRIAGLSPAGPWREMAAPPPLAPMAGPPFPPSPGCYPPSLSKFSILYHQYIILKFVPVLELLSPGFATLGLTKFFFFFDETKKSVKYLCQIASLGGRSLSTEWQKLLKI